MSFRRAIFWSVVAVVESILILWILSLALFSPKPEPIALGKAEVLPLTDVSTVASIAPPAQESPVVRIHIDAGHRIGKYLKIRGWACIDNQQTRGQKVYVQLGRPDGTVVHYTTLPAERLDVATRFKNPLYNACGFSALIPLTDGFDVDSNAMRLVVENKSGMYTSPLVKAGILLSPRTKIMPLEPES